MSDSKPDNALKGQPPAPDDLRDKDPEGHNPNASFHVENDPKWKKRPEQYPAAKDGIANPDRRPAD